MLQQSRKTNVHDRKLRVFDVENKATLLESVAVQGWDFITQPKLSVQGGFLGGRSRYQLVGPMVKSQYMRSIQQ